MKAKQYRILDAPEAGDVFPVLLFAFPLFFTGTFLLTLMGTGLEDNHVALSWIDVGLHLLAMVVAVLPMREYLSFSWLAVSGDNKARIPRCFLDRSCCAGLCYHAAAAPSAEIFGALPLVQRFCNASADH